MDVDEFDFQDLINFLENERELRPSILDVVYATFRCIVIGDGGVGKTSIIKRNYNGVFNPDCSTTVGIEMTNLVFYTARGQIRFNVWDVTGSETFDGLRDGCYAQAECAIIMFDLRRTRSYKSVANFYRDLVRISPAIPIVLCGNKADARGKKMKAVNIAFHRTKNIPYFGTSAKTGLNVEEPFLSLARKMLNEPDLEFMERPPPQPEIDPLIPRWVQVLFNDV